MGKNDEARKVISFKVNRREAELIVRILYNYREGPDNDEQPTEHEQIRLLAESLCVLAGLESPY